jgi:peptidoglycan hydrolase-like protein with peptidoglycan-binding domain
LQQRLAGNDLVTRFWLLGGLDDEGDALKAPGFPTGNVDMNRMRPLAKGASGMRVKWLQKRLGFTGTNVDGKFGPMTDTAVRKLQASKPDLVADGIVGPRTFAYLCWMNP